MARSVRTIREHHRERHRPSGFGFAFADRIGYLDGQRWDQVTNGSTLFLRRDILEVIESHGPSNVEPRYAMVFRGADPVAAIATQVLNVTPDRFGRPKAGPLKSAGALLKKAISPLRRRVTPPIQQRVLVGGNLLSWGFHGVAFAGGAASSDVWPGVAEALYRIRRANKLTGQANLVMVKDAGADQSGIDALRRFSYRPVETEPNMVLHVPPAWQSYDDYLGALDAKRRRSLRDIEKKLAAAGCVVERIGNLEDHADRLYELYLAVHNRASIRLVTLPPGFFPALARTAGDAFRCTVIRRQGRIIGFVTALKDGDTAVGYYVGFDRGEAERGLPLYLRLLHASVADAIDWRCTRLSMGRTALEPKAGVGAKPEPMSIWVRHRMPSINWLMRGVIGAVPHDEPPERNPFRK